MKRENSVEHGDIQLNDAKQRELALIMSRKDLKHDCLIRNGYAPPSLKSNLCSMDLLDEIIEGKVFCFKQDQLRIRKVAKCPSVKRLNELGSCVWRRSLTTTMRRNCLMKKRLRSWDVYTGI